MDFQTNQLGSDVTTSGTVSQVHALVIAAIELLGWRHGRTEGEASELVWAENIENNTYEQIIPIWIRKGPFMGEVMVRLVLRGLGPETKLQMFHSDLVHIDIARPCFKELIKRADEIDKGKFDVQKGKIAKHTIGYKQLQRSTKWP